MRTAAIIPAFNEAERIENVLEAVCLAHGVDEVIVVVDGGTDDTARIAARIPGVRVIKLTRNVGKGGALAIGSARRKPMYWCLWMPTSLDCVPTTSVPSLPRLLPGSTICA